MGANLSTRCSGVMGESANSMEGFVKVNDMLSEDNIGTKSKLCIGICCQITKGLASTEAFSQ